MKIACKKSVQKICAECNKLYVDHRWCGLYDCNRCLSMAWILGDIDIIKKVFECCDLHRPHVGTHSMPHLQSSVQNNPLGFELEDHNYNRHFILTSQPIKIEMQKKEQEKPKIDTYSYPLLSSSETNNNTVEVKGSSLKHLFKRLINSVK